MQKTEESIITNIATSKKDISIFYQSIMKIGGCDNNQFIWKVKSVYRGDAYYKIKKTYEDNLLNSIILNDYPFSFHPIEPICAPQILDEDGKFTIDECYEISFFSKKYIKKKDFQISKRLMLEEKLDNGAYSHVFSNEIFALCDAEYDKEILSFPKQENEKLNDYNKYAYYTKIEFDKNKIKIFYYETLKVDRVYKKDIQEITNLMYKNMKYLEKMIFYKTLKSNKILNLKYFLFWIIIFAIILIASYYMDIKK